MQRYIKSHKSLSLYTNSAYLNINFFFRVELKHYAPSVCYSMCWPLNVAAYVSLLLLLLRVQQNSVDLLFFLLLNAEVFIVMEIGECHQDDIKLMIAPATDVGGI